MLPLQQAYEVQHSILEYLKATFGFKDREVHDAFYRFITDPEEGIFKGPYVSLKLPFVKAAAEASIPLQIYPKFPPYDHQYKAFSRLGTENNRKPQSTLITTGTSSGKTECFLFPILDYCYRHSNRPGIKVIILYPMNALATDQAKRLAETIWNDERLKGKISAGLFIGEGKDKKKFPKEMGESHIVENRDTILDQPPDILLTNFKMLDYALMRNQYHKLWGYNLEDSSLLQFLVLDELHTYDGAQGTDVANLIRRLKLKLGIPKGQICAVGTSATIGSGEDSIRLLTEYAGKVFGEDFDAASIITENRLSVDDFFTLPEEQLDTFVPRQIGLLESRMRENETYDDYIRRQKRLWQLPENTEAVALGDELKKLKLMKDLIALTGKKVIRLDSLLAALADRNAEFRRLPEWDAQNELNPREEVINSLLALISEARLGTEKKFPFLYLQIQLWIRELSGVLREVGAQPKFTWKDKVGDPNEPKALPAYFCRECGASGWLGVKDDNKNHFFHDPKQVYDYFFSNHKNVYFINTERHRHVEEYEPDNLINDWIHVRDMSLHEQQGPNTFRIQAVRKLRETKSRHICPSCNTENTMGIIGTRVATLSSITVSQVLASDLDPRTEKYRKILAFTNSVQDAAHQAGFVEARNYRFTFRASLQKIINKNPERVRLTDLQEQFIAYWKQHSDSTGQNQEDAFYYRFFPADYHGKADLDIDYRDAAKRLTPDFKREFDARMRWEVASEFGYNALIGRTLEKSGASGVRFDEAQLLAIFHSLVPWLRENNLSNLDEQDFVAFLNGILHRIRTRGGIDHEYLSKFRSNSLKLWDLNWMRDNRHFLNRMYHKRARFPRLLTDKPHGQGLLDSTFTNTNNWYRSYFIKSFPMAPNYHGLVNDFYKELIRVLRETGIMNQSGADEFRSFAIQPTAIWVEKHVKTCECDTCGARLFTAASDPYANRVKCLDYTCTGTYSNTINSRSNYYQLVYNRNLSPRIYASEHTGILERKGRENKEIDFKERPRFNSLNAIVATSTLEMGIDIGTLNTAINNSVPPLTSNFLQRVGRAGRSSGSALIVNFAQAKAHDLFYYGEPKDMMEGEVATPGCYLEAREILFRHFFAYCLDNWATADPKNHSIPGVMRTLQLSRTDLLSSDFFANRVISFIKASEGALLNNFIAFYQADLPESKALEELKTYLQQETLYERFRKVFSKLKDEYLQLEQSIRDIETAMRGLPNDEERKILESEKKAILGLKRLLDKRAVLEHLTNVGMLPNYAFPETGVTLNAWVKSNRAKASENIPTDRQFEIVRSSRSALREFAPDNYFYSQGYRFAISGLNTYDWKDAGTLLVKRFCSNCDHIDTKALSSEPQCPKCGDASWASEKNQHVFVRLNSVKSVNLRDKSTLDDSSDERSNTVYRISRHLKFDRNSFQGAWGMREIPFGIEYMKNVDITEVNLGLTSAVHANKVNINQMEEVPYHGFVTCKVCGKSSSKFNQKDYKFHYGYCKHKERVYEGKSDDVFEEVFLFREMKTEALKILLPVQEFESDATINMFKAGLELGLKKYYEGNPQHLSMLNYAEFNARNSRFDKYLVLYDNIPGGTGYLEKLFSPKEFTAVISKAYQAIRDCGCKLQGKDGCYRCIFTYSNQFIQQELSRNKAEKLFRKIEEKSNAWDTFNTGLSALTSDGQIEESELEERFIRSLRIWVQNQHPAGFRFEDAVSDGTIMYKMKISHGDFSYYYTIRPQVDLGENDGVRYHTRADFLISLTSVEENGIPLENDEILNSFKPIAIYMDGYTYHASTENFRFADDLKKRIAIYATGSLTTCTLTWSDMERQDIEERDNDPAARAQKRDNLYLDKQRYNASIQAFRAFLGNGFLQEPLLSKQNNFERFLWILTHPLANSAERAKKIGLLLALQQEQFGRPSIDAELLDNYLHNPEAMPDNQQARNRDNGNFYLLPTSQLTDSSLSLKVAIRLADFSIRASIYFDRTASSMDKGTWEQFWALYNLIQEFDPEYNLE
ncbi:MAG: DEAD/DEAH box helicase [Bacteroidota bacterium]|jgi:DEAD/DEAH box helicase domain-containing protein